jgi:hypothetical protein
MSASIPKGMGKHPFHNGLEKRELLVAVLEDVARSAI